MPQEEKKPVPANEKTGKTKKRSGLVIVLAVILILALAGGCFLINSPSFRYKKAMKQRDSGNYEAMQADVREKLSSDPDPVQAALRTPRAVVSLGSFEQDDNAENGKERIEWVVLDVQDGRSLLISKYALDCRLYNMDDRPDLTWETCSLRKWMNEDFLREAFSGEEQKSILEITVSADRNPEYDTDPGKDTEEQIFLLSIPEAERYFDSDAAGQCIVSPYALAKGCYADPRDGSCDWWLRSPGFNTALAAFVDSCGVVRYSGDAVASAPFGVRPALWISTEP